MNLIEALETIIHVASEVTPTVDALEKDPNTSEEFINNVKHFWKAVNVADVYISALRKCMKISA